MKLLPAYIEIMPKQAKSTKDAAPVGKSRRSQATLREVRWAPWLHTLVGRSCWQKAMPHRRSASGVRPSYSWQAAEAPYSTPRTRELMGMACRTLRDEEAATMELEAAKNQNITGLPPPRTSTDWRHMRRI